MEQDADERPWAIRFAVLLGRRLAELRERARDDQGRKMTAQALADRTAELGMPIDRSVIAKLEKGHRQTVSVPELLVLAKALGVPPALLVFPLGDQESIEVLPGRHIDTWMALKWFTAEGPFPGELTRESDGRWFIDTTHDDVADWNTYGQVALLFREHEQHLIELSKARGRRLSQLRSAAGQRDEAERARLDEDDMRLERLALLALRGVRNRIRQLGAEPPQMHPAIATDVDELPGAGLTFSNDGSQT